MWVIKAKKNNKVYIHADKFADSKHAKMVGDNLKKRGFIDSFWLEEKEIFKEDKIRNLYEVK